MDVQTTMSQVVWQTAIILLSLLIVLSFADDDGDGWQSFKRLHGKKYEHPADDAHR
jgi:hypothetical protein